MIRTFQERMGLIATHRSARPEEWTDEEWVAYERDSQENPEPRDDSIPR